jgi:hypothetical protein
MTFWYTKFCLISRLIKHDRIEKDSESRTNGCDVLCYVWDWGNDVCKHVLRTPHAGRNVCRLWVMLTNLAACITMSLLKTLLHVRRRISTAANITMSWTFTFLAGFDSKFPDPRQHKAENPYSSIPGQYVWDFWSTEWHRDRFFSQYFSFPLSVPFHHYSILINSSNTDAM